MLPRSTRRRTLALRAAALATVALLGPAACRRGAEQPVEVAPGGAPSAAPARAPDVTPPARPESLEVKVSAAGAELTWSRSAGDASVAAYEVLRDTAPIARVEEPRAQDPSLRPGQRHCYAVVAFDSVGYRSSPSAEVCVEALDVTPPSTPESLTARLVARGELELHWAPSSDDVAVAGYEVLRGDRVIASSPEPRFTIRDLAPGRRLCHAVRALDAAGNRSAPTAPACIAAADDTPPSTPGDLAAVVRGDAVELRWSPSTDDVGVARYEVLRDGAVAAAGSLPSAKVTGLRANTRACFTVRAYDAAANASGPAGPVCVTPPDVTPPTTPPGVVASVEPGNVVSLRWGAASDDVGVVRYEVLGDHALVAKTDALRASVRGLRPAGHCFQVRACDAADNCSPGSASACITLPDVEPPARVADVAAEATSDRSIAVRWAPSSDDVGVARYEVRDGGRLVGVTQGETHVVDGGLRPAKRHCYAVTAWDAAGNASRPSAPACATTPDLLPPEIPPNVVAAARSSHEIVVAWDASRDDVGVAGYEVLRDEAVVARTDHLQASVDGLAPDGKYCLSVRALDAAGNRSGPSDPVCVATAAPSTPVAPSNLRVQAAPRALELSWDPSPDRGVVYVVFWDRGKSERIIGTTPASTFRVFGNAATERHCYRVAAVDEQQRASPRTFPVCASLSKAPGPTADARPPATARNP